MKVVSIASAETSKISSKNALASGVWAVIDPVAGLETRLPVLRGRMSYNPGF